MRCDRAYERWDRAGARWCCGIWNRGILRSILLHFQSQPQQAKQADPRPKSSSSSFMCLFFWKCCPFTCRKHQVIGRSGWGKLLSAALCCGSSNQSDLLQLVATESWRRIVALLVRANYCAMPDLVISVASDLRLQILQSSTALSSPSQSKESILRSCLRGGLHDAKTLAISICNSWCI